MGCSGLRFLIEALTPNGISLPSEPTHTTDSVKRSTPHSSQSNSLELQLKLADAGVRIPIIFITGHGDISMTVKAIKSGAVEFLTKPFDDQDLLNAIQRVFDRERVTRHEQGGLLNAKTL
ncbi:MAG: response regulator [Edaphobacter sp.]